jgi:hypothetical protein
MVACASKKEYSKKAQAHKGPLSSNAVLGSILGVGHFHSGIIARASGRPMLIQAHCPDCPGIRPAPAQCPGQVMVCFNHPFPSPKPGQLGHFWDPFSKYRIVIFSLFSFFVACENSSLAAPQSTVDHDFRLVAFLCHRHGVRNDFEGQCVL